MTKYREFLDEETGDEGFLFNAKLVAIGETILQNTNNKNYKIVNLEFFLPDGQKVVRSALVYESNYKHGIDIGGSYLTTLTFDEEGEPHLRMSHLMNADRATAEEFSSLLNVKDHLVEEEEVI